MKRFSIFAACLVMVIFATSCAMPPTQGRIYRSGQEVSARLIVPSNQSNLYDEHQTLDPETFRQAVHWDESRQRWVYIGMRQQELDHRQAMERADQMRYQLDTWINNANRIIWMIKRLEHDDYWW